MLQSTLTQIELAILFLLLIPTLYAMLDGAPFVPTEMEQVNRMLKAAKLKPGMKVYELGSGDGRLIHKASKNYGVQGVGYEFSPLVWAWSKFLGLFWRSGAKLKLGNFWKKDLRDADVIFCYLLTHSMVRMHKIIWPTLKPGTLVVSNAFVMKDLKPWKKVPRDSVRKLGPIWIYKKEEPKKRVKTK